MALRCLLVGLVASLGFELPSGQEVTSWTRLGRDWVASRTITLADIAANVTGWGGPTDPSARPVLAPVVAAVAPIEPAATPETSPEDASFAAIGEEMVSSFAADFETNRALIVANTAEPAPAQSADEPAAVEDGIQPELDSMTLAHSDRDPGPSSDTSPASIDGDPSPSGRLTSAVRATREAMTAWGSLMQAVGREVVAR